MTTTPTIAATTTIAVTPEAPVFGQPPNTYALPITVCFCCNGRGREFGSRCMICRGTGKRDGVRYVAYPTI